jgi:tRNA (cytidine/uridine-2'-O-)-methyltransferase
MFDVVLFEPQIAPNTGNIIRLCANTGARLHLVEPLGFEPDDAKLRRAGLDYHDWAQVQRHEDWPECLRVLNGRNARRVFALSTRATCRYDKVSFRGDDIFLFGPETRGLPPALLEQFPEQQRLRLPMQPNNRSLNLSNAVAVVVFEAWRQCDFAGSA